MQKLSTQIKAKVPAILTNVVLLFCIAMITVLMVPPLQGIGQSIPGTGIAAGMLLSAVLVIIGVYFALKIFTDILALTETASETFVNKFPWVKEGRQRDVQKAIKEIVASIIIVMILTPLGTMMGTIPVVGPMVMPYVLPLVAISVLLLLFDAGKIFYVELNEWSQKVANLLAGEAEKLESKPAKSKAKKKK